VQVKPGAGPRHLAFHPKGKYLFVLNELHSTVTSFSRDSGDGRLEERQTLSTLPNDFTGTNTGAEIEVSEDGRFLYCSNRGHDSVAIFAINPRDESLNLIGHESTRGRTPRNLPSIRRESFCWWQTKTPTTSWSSAWIKRLVG
jgi:6-phosphogluconolactonase